MAVQGLNSDVVVRRKNPRRGRECGETVPSGECACAWTGEVEREDGSH